MQPNNNEYLIQKRKQARIDYYNSLQNKKQVQPKEEQTTFLPEIKSNLVKAYKTLESVYNDIQLGVLKGFEGMVDTGASALNKIGILSDKKTENFIEKDYSTEIMNKLGNMSAMGGPAGIYKNLQERKKYGRVLTLEERKKQTFLDNKVGNVVSNVAQGVGQMLPSLAIGQGIGGVVAKLGASAKYVNLATQLGQSGAFATNAIGSSTQEALIQGAELDDAQTYGLISGALEAAIEYASGGIGGTGAGVVQKIAPKVVKNKAVKFIVGALGEGAEEMISEAVNPIVKRITYDENASNATKEQILEAGLIGSLCGMVMQGGQILSTPKGIRIAQDIQNELDYMENNKDNDKLVNESYNKIQKLSEQFANELEKVGLDSNIIQAEHYEKQIRKTKSQMEKEASTLKEGETSLYAEDLERYNTRKDESIKSMSEESRTNYLSKTNQYYKYDYKTGDRSEFYNSLNDEYKAKVDETVEFMNNAQERAGTSLSLELDFAETDIDVSENGFIDVENNRIVLNPYNMDVRKAKNNILAHELTHLSENTKNGKKLRNYILKTLKESGIYDSKYDNFSKLYSKHLEQKENSNFNKMSEEQKRDYIDKELVANFVQENLFASQESVNKLVEEDTSIAKSILNWIKEKISYLNKNKAERETQKMLKKAENMYSKALDDVRRSRQSEKTNVKYSIDNKEVKNDEQSKEYENEFRRIQEESRREFNNSSWRERSERNNEALRRRLSDNFRRRLDSRGYNSSTTNAILLSGKKNTSFRMYQNVEGNLFHDIFEISRTYLKNGELVDLHENYDDCTCYLSDDGLQGFAITNEGDLVSVFNADSSKKGFLSAIAPIVKEKALTLDCFASIHQNLEEIYSKIFGFKTASIMDYNMEYDHDGIAEKHSMPQVAFMVNVDENIERKHFNKDQYDEAKENQMSVVRKYLLDNGNNIKDNKKYSLKDSTITKVKGQVSTVNKTLSEIAKEKALQTKIQLIDAQAGIIDTFKKLGANKKADIVTNFARGGIARGNEALNSGIFDKKQNVLSKGYDEVFVNTIPKEYLLKENTEKRDLYIRERNNYLYHYLNIDRMENVFYKLNENKLNQWVESKIGISKKGMNQIKEALIKSKNKELTIKDIKNINLSKKDYLLIENELRNIKSVFGKFIDYKSLSKKDISFLEESIPDVLKNLQEKPMSESEFFDILEKEKIDINQTEIANITSLFREITADESRQAIKEIDEIHPEFKNQVDDIWNYGKALLELEYQSGLITKEVRDYLRETYPHYVPSNRDLYGYSPKGADSNTKSVHVAQNVKHAKGSDLLLEPLEIMLARRTMRAYQADAINTLALELEKAYEKSSLEENEKKELIQFDNDMTIPSNVESIEYEKVGASKDGKYITYYKNGKMKKMYVTNETFEGFADLTNRQKNESYETITKGIRKANKLFKSSITSYNPLFIFRNLSRDIKDAVFYSKSGFGKIVSKIPKAVNQMIKKGTLWQEYLRAGNLHSSFFDFNIGTNSAKPISRFEQKVGSKIRKIGNMIEKLNIYTEQYIRFSEYIISRESGKSVQEASYDANEVTINFGRSGIMTRELNATIIPFLNPAVQGTSKFVRTFTSPKSAKEWRDLLFRVAALGIVPALFNAILYDDDEEYQALGNYYKDNFYMIKINESKFIKIPSGRITGLLRNTAVKLGDVKEKGIVDAFEGYGENLTTSLSPVNGFRTIFSPINDVTTNTTWYGGQIENQSYSKVKPGNRYNETTSLVAKKIGGVLNYSPLKIDYLLEQYTGVVGDLFLNTSGGGTKTAIANNFIVDSTFKNKYSSDFYSKLEKLEYKKSDGDIVATLQVRYMNKCKTAIADIQEKQLELYAEGKLSKKERAEQDKVLQIAVNNAYKNAIENVELLGKFLNENCELSSISVEDDYIEAIRQCFGAKEALKQYNSQIYEKATVLNEIANIDFNAFYVAYLDGKEIEADYDNTGKLIPGSKKAKTVEFINGFSQLNKQQKMLMLAVLGYKPSNTESIEKYLRQNQHKTSQELSNLTKILNLY